MKTIAFFSNRAGVGTTSLVYHLAWMYAELGKSVVAADLDPQANLTGMFLDQDRLEVLWPETGSAHTVYGAVRTLLDGTGGVATPTIENISPEIGLLVGDLSLSLFEEELSSEWPTCVDHQAGDFRVLSALWRIIRQAAVLREAEFVLIDVGPNLGAINRAALVCAEHVVLPLAPDVYSWRALHGLGQTLRRWRAEWNERRARSLEAYASLPKGSMAPAGYTVLQHAVRPVRPNGPVHTWVMMGIPGFYRRLVLNENGESALLYPPDDSHCLAMLRHYRGLMPLAREARKPMFSLTAADGAIGGHAQAVQHCYRDFQDLAERISLAVETKGDPESAG